MWAKMLKQMDDRRTRRWGDAMIPKTRNAQKRKKNVSGGPSYEVGSPMIFRDWRLAIDEG